MKKNVIVLLSLVVYLTGLCLAEQPPSEDEKEYVISTNDILEIKVYGEPDLSATVRVSQDGMITYPLLGAIQTTGLTIRELEKQLESLLGEDYLVIPQVSIFIKEHAKISILGAVNKPGSYEMQENITLTQAIALAGGFSGAANTSSVKIIRAIERKKQTFEVNVERILSKSAQDIEVKANDVIIIEEYGKISVLGQVKEPGSLQVKENLTLTQAIALSGGFSETANTSKVKLIRTVDSKKETFEINVEQIINRNAEDAQLKPGDIIIVEEHGRFSVMGQVNRPGVYNLRRGLTVVEAIGLSGGFTPIAAQNSTKVIREENGERKVIRVPIAYIMKSGDKSKDILLKEGDTIVVPESFF